MLADLDLQLGEHDLVADLELKIRNAIPTVCLNKQLRLIVNGKLLTPNTATLSSFNVKSGSFIHAVISNKPSVVLSQLQQSASSYQQTAGNSTATHRGFDVLLDDGLSVDEVAAIRSFFRPSVNEFASLSPMEANLRQAMVNEDNLTYRGRLETAWIRSQSEFSEYYMNLPSHVGRPGSRGTSAATGDDDYNERQPLVFNIFDRSHHTSDGDAMNDLSSHNQSQYRDLLWGILWGFAFGFLALICIWENDVSYRQKLGILIGVALQILFGSIGSSAADNSKA